MRSKTLLFSLIVATANASAQTCNCDRSSVTPAPALYNNLYKTQAGGSATSNLNTSSSGISGSGSSGGGGLASMLGFSGGSLGSDESNGSGGLGGSFNDMSWSQMAAAGSSVVGIYGAATGDKTLATVGGLGAAGFGLASTDMGKNMLNGDFSQLSFKKANNFVGVVGSLSGNDTMGKLNSLGNKLEKYGSLGTDISRITNSPQSSQLDGGQPNSQGSVQNGISQIFSKVTSPNGIGQVLSQATGQNGISQIFSKVTGQNGIGQDNSQGPAFNRSNILQRFSLGEKITQQEQSYVSGKNVGEASVSQATIPSAVAQDSL
jgi:hypothetical protein